MPVDAYVSGAEVSDADDPGDSSDLGDLGDRWPEGGSYALVLELPRPITVEVGALGAVDLPAGGYAYVGSALGTGGFSRVARHAEVAAGEREVRHWHVDYLTGHPESRLRAVVLAPGADAECPTARALDAAAVPGFGASDCDCPSHLARRPSWTDLQATLRDGFSRKRS